MSLRPTVMPLSYQTMLLEKQLKEHCDWQSCSQKQYQKDRGKGVNVGQWLRPDLGQAALPSLTKDVLTRGWIELVFGG